MVYFHKTPSGKFLRLESIIGFRPTEAQFLGVFFGRQKPTAVFADKSGKYGRASVDNIDKFNEEYGYGA